MHLTINISGPIVSCSLVSDECVQADFAAVHPEFPGPTQKDPAFPLRKPTRKSSLPAFMVTLTAIVLFGAIARAQAASYFISASGPLGNGSGSSAANAADASTAPKHDSIVNGAASGTTIRYSSGTFLTNGNLNPTDNVVFQGNGYGNTTVMVANGTNTGGTPIWSFTRGVMTGVSWYDMTIDFNPMNQPWWGVNTGGGSFAMSMTTANHCTIQRCRFIHAAQGSTAESFPIIIGIN